MVLLIEFEKFPAELDLVGKILASYGEIEFGLLSCLGSYLDNDMNTSARLLFRIRGEAPRLDVCDAILRPWFIKLGIGSKWDCAFGAARHCKNIRNQYAHCHWQIFNEAIHFLDFDQDAKSREGEMQVSLKKIDSNLLQEQLDYFQYAVTMLFFLHAESEKKKGRQPVHATAEPKSLRAPHLHIPKN